MNNDLVIRFSELADGSMSKAVSDEERLMNRQRFLENSGISAGQTVLVHLKYEGQDYHRYHTISTDHAGSGITSPSELIADALFTKSRGIALLLPVADCIGAVVYDASNAVFGLAHFGRHNLIDEGGRKTVEYMTSQFGTKPNELEVWLSPAAGKSSYPLFDFDGRSLHEVAVEQLMNAGVSKSNITIDSRDTTNDQRLFSHSEFLKGNRASDGRQAVVVMMK